MSIILGVSIVSGLLGWLVFRPRRANAVEKVYSNFAQRFGFDKSWSIKLGYIVKSAAGRRCGEITASDYQEVYKALGTGVPEAQRRGIGVIINCPPPDKGTCYSKVNAVAQTGKTVNIQNWAYGTLWNLWPDKRDEIRREAAESKFPEIAQEVSRWPNGPVTY